MIAGCRDSSYSGPWELPPPMIAGLSQARLLLCPPFDDEGREDVYRGIVVAPLSLAIERALLAQDDPLLTGRPWRTRWELIRTTWVCASLKPWQRNSVGFLLLALRCWMLDSGRLGRALQTWRQAHLGTIPQRWKREMPLGRLPRLHIERIYAEASARLHFLDAETIETTPAVLLAHVCEQKEKQP